MFDFHQDKERYFGIQRSVTTEDIIPFIMDTIGDISGKYVLEIGCAEGGVLQAFIDHHCTGAGVELSSSRYESACYFMSEAITDGKVTIINKNIYDIENPLSEFGKLFDIIILKDVIEHIPNQSEFLLQLKNYLAKDGLIFFAYPPWWMPFGGHQQVCRSKILRTLPWVHLLPGRIYPLVLKIFGEGQDTIHELMEVKSTGINIEKMYHIINLAGFNIQSELLWFINPIYKFKFGLKKRKLISLLSKIPYLRNFYTTAHYISFSI